VLRESWQDRRAAASIVARQVGGGGLEPPLA
jgi:hypothetical protein